MPVDWREVVSFGGFMASTAIHGAHERVKVVRDHLWLRAVQEEVVELGVYLRKADGFA